MFTIKLYAHIDTFKANCFIYCFYFVHADLQVLALLNSAFKSSLMVCYDREAEIYCK